MITENNNHLEYPIVCEACLGPNHLTRMLKYPEGGVCHISGRPYDVFRWKAGTGARYKKTVICRELASLKDVCQVCMLDLKYNLPVLVRDSFKTEDKNHGFQMPKSFAGKTLRYNEALNNPELQKTIPEFEKHSSYDKLMHLVKSHAHEKRNQARVCSFFIKGCCNRGLECPFRHSTSVLGHRIQQNYSDRYNGINDPVAYRMLSRIANMPPLNPPSDKSIKTIFLGNITNRITAEMIKKKFYFYGEILRIQMLYRRKCAFVSFSSRSEAEKAVMTMGSHVSVQGHSIVIRWSKNPLQDSCNREKTINSGAFASLK